MGSERLSQLTELAGRTHSIDSRIALIEHGIAGFLESPLVGIGLGNSHERYGQIIHNSLLWIAAELGVIGLITFGGFLVWLAFRLADASVDAPTAHQPMVVFLIMGNAAMLVFSFSVEAFYQRHWWLLFALTACVSALAAGGEGARGATADLADRPV
jgi:O-antigen ligase